ncbi:glucose-6-phosphate dehydrogenase [Streptococcus massiliensis]|uniref:Glucose-6-phosphate 1-dehydrogenase n=1 Tax=Streptococcus massiliensis TaxID=313439 RepID=A0A380L0G1_9STRE|nr:glucose-6-phosphate dehydrogenase [Streptococcus massiliensis]SUN76230.1 glucose-6-phosphate 1-dehydrogenase [Streptococcus massiliensis]
MSSKVIVTIFGASGDLAKRKLYPSLFRLYKSGNLSEHFAVIGTARRPWSKAYFESIIVESIEGLAASQEEAWEFASHFYYQSHDVNDKEHYVELKKLQTELTEKYQTEGNKLFFLSMAPEFFGTIAKHLKSEHIVDGNGFERLIVEKPFGTSLKTASKLNSELVETFDEEQIFRIDHYLGKEMIQNIFAIRFANLIFDQVWNKDFIDNVQITFAESIGVEERGGYYDHSGALKDMIQNHALQLLSILAMDKPESFSKEAIRAEKIKVFQSLVQPSDEELKHNFVRGQYAAGIIDGRDYIAYRDEFNVDPESQTETFAAGTFFVDSERFIGVPFFFRTGKRMTEKGTRVNITFKKMPSIFGEEVAPNILTIYIQPTEGFSLKINGKEVGERFSLAQISYDYRTDATASGASPEPYEKLIFDVLNNDSTNFSHWDEVRASWALIDRIEEAWANNKSPLHSYASGTMGPQAAFDMLAKFNAKWQWEPDNWYRERDLLK